MFSTKIPKRFPRFVQALMLFAAVMLVASSSFAFGSVRLKRTRIPEIDGRWKFSMMIDYGSKPHLGHIPFDFIFVQKVYYEYSITDQNPTPTLHRKQMHNQQPSREEMDIGFADARGEPWRRTKFSFSLRRDRGYEAGEYLLTIKRSSDGRILGRPIRVILDGKNEVIDRRSIVFAGEKKEDKEKRAKAAQQQADKGDDGSAEAEDTATNDTREDESSAADEQPEAQVVEGPPEIKERPGAHGCGCRLEQSGPAGGGQGVLAVLAAMLLAGLALRRR